jgi:SAM-dependent methyltransferase
VTEEAKRVVAEGYDAVYERYEQWDDGDGVRDRWLDAVLPLVAGRAAALDLGCGTGVKATARLAREFVAVTAIDVSPRSIERARTRVPAVDFRVGDMTAVEHADQSFDLVTAFFSVLHVPAGEQPELLARIARWLVPGGVLLFNTALHAGDGGEPDWLGVPMYWSSLGREATLAAVVDAGLEVLDSTVDTIVEHGGGATFLWVIARRPR